MKSLETLLKEHNTNRKEYSVDPISMPAFIAQRKGWSLHETGQTINGLVCYIYRSIPEGGYQREIWAECEMDAANALTPPR